MTVDYVPWITLGSGFGTCGELMWNASHSRLYGGVKSACLPRRMPLPHGCVFTQQSCVCGWWFASYCILKSQGLLLALGLQESHLSVASEGASRRGMEMNQNWASTVSKPFSCSLLLLRILPISAPEQLRFCNSLSVMRRHWIIYNRSLMSSQFHYILGLWKAAIAL